LAVYIVQRRMAIRRLCKNWLNLLFQKLDITISLWGRLGGVAPTTFWPWGRSPPSPPWSRRLWWCWSVSRFLSSYGVVIRFTACTVRLAADWCQQRFAARIRMQNGERERQGAQQMTESGQV